MKYNNNDYIEGTGELKAINAMETKTEWWICGSCGRRNFHSASHCPRCGVDRGDAKCPITGAACEDVRPSCHDLQYCWLKG